MDFKAGCDSDLTIGELDEAVNHLNRMDSQLTFISISARFAVWSTEGMLGEQNSTNNNEAGNYYINTKAEQG